MSNRLLLPLVLVLALFAAACGGGTEETVAGDADAEATTAAPETTEAAEAAEEATTTAAPETTTEAPTTTVAETTTAAPETTEAAEPAEEEADTGAEAVEVNGQAIYESNCSRCHASDGTGGRGPSLVGIADKRDGDTSGAIDLVTNGGRQMPSFGGSLSEAEVIAVVDFAFSAWPDAANS